MTRPYYRDDETPPDTDTCPICGAPMNMWGRCMDWRSHDDLTESYRDET